MYLSIGLIFKRLSILPDNSAMVLNHFVLYISLPALILQKIPSLTFSTALLIPLLTPWLLLIAIALLVLLIGKQLAWPRQVTGALLIVLPLGNTSFLGFPIIQGFYGDVGLSYAVIYDQLGTFLGLSTYATVIAALYGSHTRTLKLSHLITRILTFPAFVSLIVALIIKDMHYPPLMRLVVDNLALTLVPVIMIAVGLNLNFRLPSELKLPFFIGLFIKLILMPVLVYMGLNAAGQDGLAVTVSVFCAAMPPMISAGALAISANLAPKLVSALVGYGLLLSLATLPSYHWLLALL
nr:AEC family transporter [Neptunicella marina]